MCKIWDLNRNGEEQIKIMRQSVVAMLTRRKETRLLTYGTRLGKSGFSINKQVLKNWKISILCLLKDSNV